MSISLITCCWTLKLGGEPSPEASKQSTLEQLELKSNTMMIKSSHNEMAAHASLDISAIYMEITLLPMLTRG